MRGRHRSGGYLIGTGKSYKRSRNRRQSMTQNTAGQKSQAAAVMAATVPPPAKLQHSRKVSTLGPVLVAYREVTSNFYYADVPFNHAVQSCQA